MNPIIQSKWVRIHAELTINYEKIFIYVANCFQTTNLVILR